MPRHTRGDFPVSAIEWVLSKETLIYMVTDSGRGSKRFLRYFKHIKGGACLGMPWGTSSSVLLNVSHHKKHEYVWFRDDNLNSFKDVKPFIR